MKGVFWGMIVVMLFAVAACVGSSPDMTGHDAEGNEFGVFIFGDKVSVSWGDGELKTLVTIDPEVIDFRVGVADCNLNGADDIVVISKREGKGSALVAYDGAFYPKIKAYQLRVIQYDKDGRPKDEDNEHWHNKLSHCLPSWNF